MSPTDSSLPPPTGREPPRLRRSEFLTEPDLPFTLARREPQPPYPLHSHEFSELVIVFSGSGAHFTAEAEYEVMAGDVYVIRGNLAHGYRDLHDLCLVNLIFNPAGWPVPPLDLKTLAGYHALFSLEPEFRQQQQFAGRLRLTPAELAETSDLLAALEAELTDRRPAYAFSATARFMLLVAFLARCYTPERSEASRNLLRLGGVLGYLESRLTQGVTIGELCDLAHMSESSLTRAFRRVTGHTPLNYHLNLRMRRACRLLAEGDLPVTHVAFDCGFRDSNYFARQFRRLMGVTPRDYRTLARREGRSRAGREVF